MKKVIQYEHTWQFLYQIVANVAMHLPGVMALSQASQLNIFYTMTFVVGILPLLYKHWLPNNWL